MRVLRLISLLVVSSSVLASCGGAGQEAEQERTRQFPGFKVPSMMTSESDRLAYIGDHYWDKLWDTALVWKEDSSHIVGVSYEDIKHEVGKYVSIIAEMPLEQAVKAMRHCCQQAHGYDAFKPESISFERFNDVMELYLFDPNSPLRNEDLYMPYAQYLSECDGFGEEVKANYARQAQQCSLNPTGSVAADFSFSDRNGKVRTLHSVKADHTILFFSNPGCEACKAIIDYLRSSGKVAAMLAVGRLAVVNVYIDEDVESWYGYMSYYPQEWFNGYDHNQVIRTDELYDVRAIPSLYLLDKDKKVLLKDCTEDKLFAYLEKL